MSRRREIESSPVKRRARQRIHYLRTADGVRLAWADASTGPLLVKAANWLTHLEYEWESPVWGHWIGFFCNHFRLVRYDERGCGMSDWNVGDLSSQRRLEDLESVVAAAAPREPFVLLGISQGAATCLAFAARHPEQVSHLVLYGGYARGWARRGEADQRLAGAPGDRRARALWLGEGQSCVPADLHLAIRARRDQRADDLVQRAVPEDDLAGERPPSSWRPARRSTSVDVLEKVRTPTLVVHARDDQVVPIGEGRLHRLRNPAVQSSSSWTRRITSSWSTSRPGNASAPPSSSSPGSEAPRGR